METSLPNPQHISFAVQMYLAHLWRSNATFWFDSHPFSQAFSAQRNLPPVSLELADVAFCFTSDGCSKAIQARVKILISNQTPSGYTNYPIHNYLFVSYLQPNQLQEFQILPNPPLFNPLLWFNSSKTGSFLVSRVSQEKWGPSLLILTNLQSGEVRALNDGNPAHDIYEDPRTFIYKNKVYASVTSITNYTTGVHTSARIGILDCSAHGNPVPVRIPIYGKNKETGPEKNWGFFEALDGSLCAIYSYSPWKIIQIHDDNSCSERVTLAIDAIPPTTHGATCPTPAPLGNKIVMWAFGRRRQEYIAVAFCPHRLTPIGYSLCPFFSTERLAHQLFYAGSAEFDTPRQEWIFIGGLNDVRNVIIRVPHAAVLADFKSID